MTIRTSCLCGLAFWLACGVVLGLATASEAIETVPPASVYPVDRVYPLAAVGAIDGEPSDGDWAKAYAGEGFFAKGLIENQDARTVFRMLRGQERLYVRIECASRGTKDKKESVEFYVTQAGKPDFPCIAVVANEAGAYTIGLATRAHTWWTKPQVIPLDETVIPRKVSKTAGGWKLEFSLPFDELDIPREGARFNVVHGLAGGEERFAWCDLGGATGPSNQFNIYALTASAKKVGSLKNGLKLPATLSVGVNKLSLMRPDSDARLRIGRKVFKPIDGVFNVVVRDRGPLDMHLTDAAGNVTAAYHADVRRPIIIDIEKRYLPAAAKKFDLDVALDIAGDQPADMVVVCRRGKGSPQQHEMSFKSGHHRLSLPVPAGDGTEVRVTAEARVPLSGVGKSLTLDALHWFAIGVLGEDVAIYRKNIHSLPTDRLYWAILVDTIPDLLNDQRGDGDYNAGQRRRSRWSRLWSQMCVYAPALLYKTNRPDNPYFGDKRLLDSAIMGMEYALRPEIRMEELACPDSRSPQAFLLTYDLLKDDIEPARRAYWAEELKQIAESEIDRFLRRIVDKYTFYSIDCETSTNHMSHHVANVYLAGRIFGRDEWKGLATMLMHRLARHGREGYFEEQRGSPVNHYTWLTASALGAYYEHSGDVSVLPTLQACARYMTAITAAQGQTMALHDSRNSQHRLTPFGDFVLSLTAEGRRAARVRIFSTMGDNPTRVSRETLFRIAENAANYHPGEEVDIFASNAELSFPYGIIVRKDGFHYALSTIARGAVSGNYVLDAQNAVEMFHKDAGCILNGGNSQSQPEAGSFWRKLKEPDWEGKTVGTSNDYLPHIATVAGVPGGHELLTGYRTFEANVLVQVISPTHARLEAFIDCDKGPVTFSFFPGVFEDEKLTIDPDGRTLQFRQVTFKANMPFKTEKGLRLLNPYSMKPQYKHKPVRCWLELKSSQRFILDIRVANK